MFFHHNSTYQQPLNSSSTSQPLQLLNTPHIHLSTALRFISNQFPLSSDIERLRENIGYVVSVLKEDFLVLQHCFICRPSDSALSEDVGIEPRTVATSALTTVSRSNQSARSYPRSARSHPHRICTSHLGDGRFMSGVYSTEYTELQRLLYGVHFIMRVKLAQVGKGGSCTPTPFHYIYHHQ
jgi:hypothetical protein